MSGDQYGKGCVLTAAAGGRGGSGVHVVFSSLADYTAQRSS